MINTDMEAFRQIAHEVVGGEDVRVSAWDGLRERFAAASATAGHCQHPGSESCEQWWQADAALRVFDEWMREIRSYVWHSPNGDVRIHPAEIEIVRYPS